MAGPLSLAKRLRIFVSHPHVEWHETSTALGEQVFKEINDARRRSRVKAKNARERQREFKELRQAIEAKPLLSAHNGVSPSFASVSSTAHARPGASQPQGEIAQAFMATLDAHPAIGSPQHVHSIGLGVEEAFASTAADSTLYQEADRRARQPRRTRISGVTPLAPASTQAAQAVASAAANDQSRYTLPESIQAAAISLAVGDKASARSQLKAAFAQAPNRRAFAQAWLECLRACEERDAYVAAAAALGKLHGFVAPAFFSSATLSNAHEAAQSTEPSRQRNLSAERLIIQAELDELAAEELLMFVRQCLVQDVSDPQQLEQSLVVPVLSFVAFKSVSPIACHLLTEALKLINKSQVPFVLQGGTVLLGVLLDMFHAQRSLPERCYWEAALESCRLLGRREKFESLISLYSSEYINNREDNSSQYKGIYREYKWLPSSAQFKTYYKAVEEGADLAFSLESGATRSSNDEAMLPVATVQLQVAEPRAHGVRVVGQGSHDRVARVLELADIGMVDATSIHVDLSRASFLQFDAAVTLLNWAQRKKEKGVQVVLHGQGLLIQALFEQISIADVATLQPHYF